MFVHRRNGGDPHVVLLQTGGEWNVAYEGTVYGFIIWAERELNENTKLNYMQRAYLEHRMRIAQESLK